MLYDVKGKLLLVCYLPNQICTPCTSLVNSEMQVNGKNSRSKSVLGKVKNLRDGGPEVCTFRHLKKTRPSMILQLKNKMSNNPLK